MRAMLNRFGRGNQTGEEHRSTGEEEEVKRIYYYKIKQETTHQ